MSTLNKWTTTADPMQLRRFGKLTEECGELVNVAGRCVIQGIDEVDPGTGKTNRQRLQDEIADVLAQCIVSVEALGLDQAEITVRCAMKVGQMTEWEAMYPADPGEGMQPVDVLRSVWNAMQQARDGDDLLAQLKHMRGSVGRALGEVA